VIFTIQVYVFRYIVRYMFYSVLPDTYYGYVPYVGYVTYRRAILRTHLCLYNNNKNKKKVVTHATA
jgi:hypothetical protein